MCPRNFVYLIEDDEGIREALTHLLTVEGYEVRSFNTGREFMAANPLAQQACLVLVVHLPDISGLELEAHLANESGEFPVIVISGSGNQQEEVTAGEFRAIDFLRKPVAAAGLVQRVREAFASKDQTSKQQGLRSNASARLAKLSRREREVLDLVVAGMASKTIAEKLGLRVKTVENHRAHLKRKLGVDSLAELVQLSFLDRAPDSSSSGKAKSAHLIPVTSK